MQTYLAVVVVVVLMKFKGSIKFEVGSWFE